MNEKMREILIEPPCEFSTMPFRFWNDELNNENNKGRKPQGFLPFF